MEIVTGPQKEWPIPPARDGPGMCSLRGLEILDELADLNTQVNALDTPEAIFGIFVFHVGGQFMGTALEMDKPGILILIEVEGKVELVLADFRIHFTQFRFQ